MDCMLCRSRLDHLHGHGACVNSRCPMFGQNQAPCCDGETACAASFVPESLDGVDAGRT